MFLLFTTKIAKNQLIAHALAPTPLEVFWGLLLTEFTINCRKLYSTNQNKVPCSTRGRPLNFVRGREKKWNKLINACFRDAAAKCIRQSANISRDNGFATAAGLLCRTASLPRNIRFAALISPLALPSIANSLLPAAARSWRTRSRRYAKQPLLTTSRKSLKLFSSLEHFFRKNRDKNNPPKRFGGNFFIKTAVPFLIRRRL